MEERRSVEASGNTIEEATEKALAQLGASREEVEIQILSQGGRRLLGLGTQEARVRVTLRPPKPEEEVTLVANEVLERLLAGMGIEAQVRLRPTDLSEGPNPIVLDITGENLGILIGRRGETLLALQYITRLIVNLRLHQWAEIIVDVEGYKKRRESSLTQLALRMADRATLLGQAVSLEPMPAHERRIIHLALRDHEKVTTESVGEGDLRKVVIFPRERTAP
ncbi:MAG: protein jag [Anaerolineae bacterium]|nr:protein jag [Anaerolineae bacterium]